MKVQPDDSNSKRGNRFQALFKRGTELLHRGKAQKATPLLEQAHKLDPSHVDAAVNLSGAYILTKKFKKAVAILEPISRQMPDDAMIWTNLGAAYLGNPVLAGDGEQKRAIAAFKQALEINPAAPHVAYNIGLIYRDRQQIDQAIDWFQRAVQTNPRDQDARNILRRLRSATD
jgi:tetratricopeptide (TPR) repeat protein